jgi:hypothetical protein
MSTIMATVPNTIIGKIQFFEQHLPVWAADPTAIGLVALEVADLANFTAQARSDFDLAQINRQISKASTEDQATSVSAMTDFGGDLIKTIRAFAEKNNDPAVYSTALIPPPAPPTPAGPPDKPTALEVELLSAGGLRLTWKGTLSQNAFFSVYRKAEGENVFTLLDSPAEKFFEDATIPAGANNLTYYIQARRDTFRVDSAWFQVNFGSGATTVTEINMAA